MTIALIVLSYEHAAYVDQCLESVAVLASNEYPIDVLFLDSHSVDGSSERAVEWFQRIPELRVAVTTARLGVCASLNVALETLTADYVAMISADDWWDPLGLASLLRVAASSPTTTAVVYGDAELVSQQGVPLGETLLGRKLGDIDPPSGQVFAALVPGNFVPAMATVVRTAALRSVGGYDESLTYEDWDMWLRLARDYEFMHVPQVVAYYRQVPGSLGASLFRNDWTNARILLKHVDLRGEVESLGPHIHRRLARALLQRGPRQVMQLLAGHGLLRPGDVALLFVALTHEGRRRAAPWLYRRLQAFARRVNNPRRAMP